MSELELKQRQALARKRRIAVVLGSVALGLLCRVLPPQYQLLCNGASKVLALFVGG